MSGASDNSRLPVFLCPASGPPLGRHAFALGSGLGESKRQILMAPLRFPLLPPPPAQARPIELRWLIRCAVKSPERRTSPLHRNLRVKPGLPATSCCNFFRRHRVFFGHRAAACCAPFPGQASTSLARSGALALQSSRLDWLLRLAQARRSSVSSSHRLIRSPSQSMER